MNTKHLVPLSIVITIAFIFVYIANLSGHDGPMMRRVNIEELTSVQLIQHRRGTDAQKELFHTLLARLTGAIKDGGAGNAIGVCNTDAKLIADEVGLKHDLEIGRTSVRLRNHRNSAPLWARSALESSPEQALILSNEQGDMGLINPIWVASACLGCHGSDADIGDQTRAKLDELYPDDEATGYAEGDLRGWFLIYIESNLATP